MATENLKAKTDNIVSTMNTKLLLNRSLPEWRPILARECQVYVLGENYIAKRFDQINYRYCEEKEAIQVVTNNLYALLRTKYFPHQDEDIDKRIKEIVSSFTMNLMTTLIKVTLYEEADMVHMSFLPDYCIAFRNGVYDFLHNKWFIKYKIVRMPQIGNKMYLYESNYLILWYLNFNFNPIEDFDINTMSFDEVVSMFKTLCEFKETRNMCFELMYNIAHDYRDIFNMDRFIHLCEIMGHQLLISFCQSFVMLIGAGSNGKNSLFDGCFTANVIPAVTNNSLEDIEKDRFITGALLNKYHNIFLETSADLHTESKMIKQITGSPYQTVEQKGVGKFSAFLNVKFLFSCNDQDTLKFSDNTVGFRRRFNIFEIFYTWDPQKRFLKRGDYYDTSFSEDLHELKNNAINAITFCYFGMMGIMHATKGFTQTFKFTYNDWKEKYTDIDIELKDRIEHCGYSTIAKWIKKHTKDDSFTSTALFDVDGKRLYNSDILESFGVTKGMKNMVAFMEDDDLAQDFFNNNYVFVATKALASMTKNTDSTAKFNSTLKKMYHLGPMSFKSIYANTMYVRCVLTKDKLKIV